MKILNEKRFNQILAVEFAKGLRIGYQLGFTQAQKLMNMTDGLDAAIKNFAGRTEIPEAFLKGWDKKDGFQLR